MQNPFQEGAVLSGNTIRNLSSNRAQGGLEPQFAVARTYSYGTTGADAFWLGAENDFVSASSGNDVVFAGNGDNWIDLGAGDDLGVGGAGSDTIGGGEGTDWLYGAAGDDTLDGDAGTDLR